MTASDRLRELGKKWDEGMLVERYDVGDELTDALPEIIAVVKAAEYATDPVTGSLPIDPEEAIEMIAARAGPALAALDARLKES